ncbi:hypothetical protein [Amycolatopsis sp. NPDC098790]|uniref:hypothetical protein n=1 Tax=Amycolatopsis sp. NPDC098790 TaxID=3363939 RepID=UPI0037F454E3
MNDADGTRSPNGLTDLEKRLVAHARRGEPLSCRPRNLAEPPHADRSPHHIRAGVLRDLLLGRYGSLDPRGVRLHHALVTGPLDLRNASSVVGLALDRCAITEPLDLTAADLRFLSLAGSRLSALYADGLRVGALSLAGLRSESTNPAGALSLQGAVVTGHLDLADAKLGGESGPVLYANALRAASMSLTRARVTGSDELGAVVLRSAHIEGDLDLTDVEIINGSGPALDATDLHVDGALWLNKVTVTGSGSGGAVGLQGAQLHHLEFSDAEVANPTGPAVNASGLRADGDVWLTKTKLRGTARDGALVLHSATVTGHLQLGRARITGRSGPGLSAQGLHVSRDLWLDDALVSGAGEEGAVRLHSAHVTGYANFLRATITNDSGPGLQADRLEVGNGLRLEAATVTGYGEVGALCLQSADISRHLDLTDVTITNRRHGTTTLALDNARVAERFTFPSGMICKRVHRRRSCPQVHRIEVDGLTFGQLAGVEWHQWLHVLRHHTTSYRPQPYQQLAAAERTAGHDGNARRILIAQQQDLHHRNSAAIGAWHSRLFHRAWGLLAGYGYWARRTAAALLLTLTAAGALGLWAGHTLTGDGHRAAERTASFTARSGTACTTVELIGVGLDRGLPLSPTGIRARCDLDTASTAGQWFTVAVWLLQAAVWGLATIALAGYTGLIRKPA